MPISAVSPPCIFTTRPPPLLLVVGHAFFPAALTVSVLAGVSTAKFYPVFFFHFALRSTATRAFQLDGASYAPCSISLGRKLKAALVCINLFYRFCQVLGALSMFLCPAFSRARFSVCSFPLSFFANYACD